MIKHNQQNESSLSIPIIISLGIHIIMFIVFTLKSPKLIKEHHTIVTLEIGSMASSQNNKTLPIPQVSPKVIQKKEVVKPVQKKAVTKSIKKETPVSKPIPAKTIQPKSTSSKTIQPMSTPEKPVTIPQQTSTIPNQQKSIPVQSTTLPTSIVQDTTPIAESVIDDLSDELDNLLNQKPQKNQHTDFLAGGSWSNGSPRKTLSFPNLTSSIPEHYKNRGYGFSVTAKITFSPQGWVSGVELIQTSGDPRIDSIFRTELRKIRVESSSKAVYDTITKSFVISVK